MNKMSIKDVDVKIAYLKDLIEISKTCTTGAEFKDKVAARYPNYSGQNYLDMSTSYFFK